MWSIRVLAGSQAGQLFPLKKGANRIGRSSSCDVRLASHGISKEHCEVTVLKDKVLITDLRSSNGTLLNGARIQNSMVHLGDKISLHDIIVDLVPTPASPTGHAHPHHLPQMSAAAQPQMYQGYAPAENLNQGPAFSGPGIHIDPGPNEAHAAPNSIGALLHNLKHYIETVALPGVYKLASLAEFRYVLGGFVLLFMILVTSLSVIPMLQITKDSIQKESQRRALTIARNLAAINQQALVQGLDSALSTDSTRLEEGVTEALIISHSDGSVIAPPARAGSFPDNPFITRARRESKELTTMLDSASIGASVPISSYNPEVGGFTVRAHAIVLYDMGTLAVDDGRTLSLFIQIFAISLILGSILFYFLYKLIEYPIQSINQQVDKALREKRDDVRLDFRFEAVQSLVSNVNSALTRAIHGSDSEGGGYMINRDAEAENVIQLIGYPCIAINKDYLIVGANAPFEMLTGASSMNIQNQELSSLPDQALQKNIGALLDLAASNVSQIASDELAFSGDAFLLSCQAITGSEGLPEYYLVTISPAAEADGGAA